MKKLINIIKDIKENLIYLQNLIHQEYDNLLKSKINIKKINLIIEEKEFFLRKIASLKKEKSFLEKKYNIFPPYLQFNELNLHWDEIISICFLLKKKNIQNKMILNEKFYLNQRFLNTFQKYRLNQNCTTYDVDGHLEN